MLNVGILSKKEKSLTRLAVCVEYIFTLQHIPRNLSYQFCFSVGFKILLLFLLNIGNNKNYRNFKLQHLKLRL